MSLTLADLSALREKRRDPIPVGELPHLIKLALNLRVPIVHLSRESLAHIAKKHPDITDFDLLILPFAIGHGLLVREKSKKHIILASYNEPMSHRRFIAAMKVVERDCEVWLTSFYRTKPRQTKRMLSNAEILKRHD